VILLLLFFVFVLAAIAAFNDTLRELVGRWVAQEEYSHGFLIPVVSAWLLWSRRHALAASIGQPSWLGLPVILVAGIMHIFGGLSALYIVSQVGFIVALIGASLCFGGLSFCRVALVPILYLAFAIPLPYFIDATLSWRLQLISSELGTSVIRMFNIPVFLEGNVIDLGVYKLQVVDACSGLRYLYPLTSLAFLAAYLFQAPFWQRAVVFLSAIPITIFMNSLRIGLVGILVNYFGPQEADGFLHMFEGWIIFLGCALLLLGEMYVLIRLTTRKPFFDLLGAPVISVGHRGEQVNKKRSPFPLIAGLVLVGATGVAGVFISSRIELYPDRAGFSSFPTALGDWRGRPSSLDPQVERGLGVTDYILSDYRGSDGRSVNFYVAYYASQRNGLSPHSPSVCIPGNGWQITKFERITYRSETGNLSFPMNRAVIANGSNRELVYYWFEQRGQKVANEWLSKYLLLKDAIFRNRTDGALVRLITPIYPGEDESNAERRIRIFTEQATPRLTEYLPSETIRPKAPILKQSTGSNS
jgi:exosortase D (VPLPA-CTERM-specific)